MTNLAPDARDPSSPSSPTVDQGRRRSPALGHAVRWLVADACAGLLAAWLTVAFRYDRVMPTDIFVRLLPWILLPVAIAPIVNLATLVDRISWRRPSSTDVVHISLAAVVSLGASLLAYYGLVLHASGTSLTAEVPRSYWPIQAVTALLISIFGRVFWAWLITRQQRPDVDRRRQTRTLLYGAGEAGTAYAREARNNERTRIFPVGFLDDDRRLWDRRVAGLPVYGDVTYMAEAARQATASQVLITMPSASGTAIRRVLDAAREAGLAVQTMPSVGELVSGAVQISRTRHVNVEDLLRRPASPGDRQRVRSLATGKKVLVTGAAGSIGSEIARQVLDAEPASLVVFDQAESPLYEIERELRDRGSTPGRTLPELSIELGSVSDPVRLRELFDRHPVDIVLHAAAYKHVPMLEQHPAEAVVTNLGGTMALLDAAHVAGVKKFVMISTDKAVSPESVMGSTKRLAELAVVDAGSRPDWDTVVVRFGNVLGSAGSVIPIFEKQLEMGAPLTVTHPDATRYFMTIPEASQLVLGAAAMGVTGTTYVLDMGEPVKIVDLANDLIRLSGYDPNSVEITFTGLRPGERLHETLFYDAETAEPTVDPRILRAVVPTPEPEIAASLRDLVARGRRREVEGGEVVALAQRVSAQELATRDRGQNVSDA